MRKFYSGVTERQALKLFVEDCNKAGVDSKYISLVIISKDFKTKSGSFELYTTKRK